MQETCQKCRQKSNIELFNLNILTCGLKIDSNNPKAVEQARGWEDSSVG